MGELNNDNENLYCHDCDVDEIITEVVPNEKKPRKIYKRKKCPHDKQKQICRICCPHNFCEHDKRKDSCVICCPTYFCPHKKLRADCKFCRKEKKVCEHDKAKRTCRICSPESFCKHNLLKASCKKCEGSSYCIHKRRKTECRICKGSLFCIHDKAKKNCTICKGSSICIHNKQKVQCKTCGGNRVCKSSWCETYGNKKYEGYCFFCYVNLFPDKITTRNYKTKELNVVNNIKEYYPEFTWVTDKKIFDGCSKKRPDLLLDLGTHIIIIEVDENAHTDYDCSCENKRLMELSQDVGHRPIVFIRFNPDSYVDKTGNKISSCWKINKKSGILQVNKKKENEWQERLNVLREQIQYWIDNSSEKTVEIIELFY